MVNISKGQENVLFKASKKVVMVRDIVRIRIYKLSEIDKLSDKTKCVKVVHITGDVENISYEELIRRYRHISGKEIKIKLLKRGINYILVGDTNIEYLAIGVPTGNSISIDGKSIKGGNVVLYPFENSVKIGTERVIPKSSFMKAFILNKKDSQNKEVANRVKNKTKEVNKVHINKENNNTEKIKDNSSIKETNKVLVKYKIIALITNTSGKTIGYLITDRKGVKHEITKARALQMCINHRIINAEAVTNKDGKQFIRGNGVVLDELRKYMK